MRAAVVDAEPTRLEGSSARTAVRIVSARAEGRQQAFRILKEERERSPLLRTTWRVVDLEDDRFLLTNTQSGVEISAVSVAAPLGDFEFIGDTQWPGPHIDMQQFRGRRMRNGRSFGVKFAIRYRDADGEWQIGEAWIDKEPRRAVVLKSTALANSLAPAWPSLRPGPMPEVTVSIDVT